MKDVFFLALGIVVIIGSFYAVLQKPAPPQYQGVSTWQVDTLWIGDKSITVEVADTDEERTQGLSGRGSLGVGQGMLFLFEFAARYGFWMKDMKFAIDIIWLNDAWQVVGVERDVPPSSYPHVFYPPSPVSYVLELPAGQAAALGIDTGSTLFFEQ